MTDAQWGLFFKTCAVVLGGKGDHSINFSDTWCSWTTFHRLTENDAGYWAAGLPNAEDIGESCIKDGGVWGQPFHFSEIAHVIIPRTFIAEDGHKTYQDIARLSEELRKVGIPCRLTSGILEIKVY